MSIKLNSVKELRKLTLQAIVDLYENGVLLEELTKLPKMLLSGEKPTYRDSIYREREVLKQRIKVYLNLNIYKVRDMELFELLDLLKKKFNCEKIPAEYEGRDHAVEVIEEACDQCPSGQYYATDLCRNCIAQSCKAICPKNAVTFSNGRAIIDAEKCVGCGLCEKACDYSAIVKLSRPCEKACGVGAIKADKKGVASIDRTKCVSCGACYSACPFGAIESPTHLIDVVSHIKNKNKVVAMFAPSIITQFGAGITLEKIKSLFLELGFSKSVEVALGADMVIDEEASEMETREEKMTTSCCPAFYEYIKLHQPDMTKYISHVDSPMMALAKKLKEEDSEYKIVFIGPCTAKKIEAVKYEVVDNVLTYTDILSWTDARGIDIKTLASEQIEGSYDGWNFAKSGGVAQAVVNKCEKELQLIQMDGIKEGAQAFKQFRLAKSNTLLEGMGCKGGCICGPSVIQRPLVAKTMLTKLKR
ncbi:monomeric [FeFe] hydrogenase [Psychrilyobacter atlanticus]|uniref:monomeric [FeFe] hydrogenase n=1 Tax=Psychrilyobacter atlanticus TaxID=271091 RepID=UPI000400B5C5|nr:monomeric [FeFe] hydrogenase [Psychrilyobacter atlanticus]